MLCCSVQWDSVLSGLKSHRTASVRSDAAAGSVRWDIDAGVRECWHELLSTQIVQTGFVRSGRNPDSPVC